LKVIIVPFESAKQQRYMFSQKPEIAKKMVEHAKAAGQPVVKGNSKKGGKMKKGYKTK
jgi:hypothetical protein